MATQIDPQWVGLETDAEGLAQGYLVRRLGFELPRDCFSAIRMPERSRVLILAVSANVLSRPPELPRSRGFETSIIETPAGIRDDSKSVEVRLSSDAFRDVFDVLISDLVNVINQEPDEAAAVDATIRQLERWQRFAAQAESGILGNEARRGLFGELLFMADVLIPGIGAEKSAECYRGPSEGIHDYALSGWAVEVKTTISGRPEEVVIRNEGQLDDVGLRALVLQTYTLAIREGGGETLPDLIDRLRAAFAGTGAEDLLEGRLLEAGYLEQHRNAYEQEGYVVRQSKAFRVADGFPRILESDLSDGIGKVSYTLALAMCAPFQIADEELNHLLAEEVQP